MQYNISPDNLKQMNLEITPMRHSAFLIAFFTTIVRYYDYALFGLAASTLAETFIPINSSDQQILAFFAVFGAAVVIRPVGSIIFGIIGDKYGRAVAVKIGALVAALSTSLIGIMPGFSDIGLWAPMMLTFCRMLFLVSLAGDVDAIRIYVAEKIGVSNRNLGNGIIASCSQIGALIAATGYHFTINFENSPDLWRINFIIGGLAGLFVMLMRHHFQESEEFLLYKANKKVNLLLDLGFFEIIKRSQLKFIIAILISGCIGGIYHFLVIFLGTFSSKVVNIMTTYETQIMTIKMIALYAIISTLAGFAADKINPFKQIIISLFVSIFILSLMLLLAREEIFAIYLPLILIGLAPFYVVPLQIIAQSLFTVETRTRMYSLSHSIGSIIFSGTTPFFCMLLWQYSGSLSMVFGFLMVLLLLLFISVMLLDIV
jgi:MFS family permease